MAEHDQRRDSNAYFRLAVELVIDFIVMYFVMYTMIVKPGPSTSSDCGGSCGLEETVELPSCPAEFRTQLSIPS